MIDPIYHLDTKIPEKSETFVFTYNGADFKKKIVWTRMLVCLKKSLNFEQDRFNHLDFQYNNGTVFLC